jgi:hypothetical protein
MELTGAHTLLIRCPGQFRFAQSIQAVFLRVLDCSWLARSQYTIFCSHDSQVIDDIGEVRRSHSRILVDFCHISTTVVSVTSGKYEEEILLVTTFCLPARRKVQVSKKLKNKKSKNHWKWFTSSCWWADKENVAYQSGTRRIQVTLSPMLLLNLQRLGCCLFSCRILIIFVNWLNK